MLAVRQGVTERNFEIISKKFKSNLNINYVHLGATNWTLRCKIKHSQYTQYVRRSEEINTQFFRHFLISQGNYTFFRQFVCLVFNPHEVEFLLKI